MPQDAQNLDLERRFTYHPPKPGQPERYVSIRGQAKALAYILAQSCPASRELSLAITHLEETVFWANAAIARNEREETASCQTG